MQSPIAFVVVFACLAALAVAWNFPVDVKSINAPSAQMQVGPTTGPVTNVSIFFKRGKHHAPDVFRTDATDANGAITTIWVVETWNRTGKKPGPTRKPSPMFASLDVYTLSNGVCSKTAGRKVTCSPWTGMSFGGKMQTTSNCSTGPGQPITSFVVNTKRGGQVTKQVMKKPPQQPVTLHFLQQEKKGPAADLLKPCTPSTGSDAELMSAEVSSALSQDFSFGGIFDGVKCGACKLGIGALLGKLCSGGSGAVCSAFPPAIPFCSVLIQAGCKAGANKLNKDTACKLIKMC